METRIEIDDVGLVNAGAMGKEQTAITITDKANVNGRIVIVMPNASFDRFAARIADHYTKPKRGAKS